MTSDLELLCDMADRLFRDLKDADTSPEETWNAVNEAGFPKIFQKEEEGGFAGDWATAFPVLRLAGYQRLNAPLAECLVAAWVWREAEEPLGDDLTVAAARTEGQIDGGRFTGKLAGVAGGASVRHVIGYAEGALFLAAVSDAADVKERSNPDGSRSDILAFDNAPVKTGPASSDIMLWSALAHTALIAGATDAVLELSIDYANERQQFGRPIGKFQAVQQALAECAEESAAVNCAGQAAARAAMLDDPSFEIGAAKARGSRAAVNAARIAHQIHGGIGFTQEHVLHRYTSRLITWSSAYGNEGYWNRHIGEYAAALGGAQIWPEITSRSDRVEKAST